MFAATFLAAVVASSCAPFEELQCTAAEHGIVIGASADSDELAAAIDQAAASFEAHFEEPKARVAVVMGGQVDPALTERLASEGYHTLPWLTGEQKQALIEERIREEVRAKLADMPEAVVERAIASGLEQVRSRPMTSKSTSAFMHEVAHLFLVGWWGDVGTAAAAAEKKYGSDAPDWLDEMAAVLAEDKVMSEGRRSHFASMLDGGDAARETPYALADYLGMEHPVLEQAKRLSEAASNGNAANGARLMLVSGEEAAKLTAGSNPIRFYSQSRVFADFMIASSGDPAIFADIARSMRAGQNFEQWLNGNESGLPRTMSGLETLWDEYLALLAQPTT